MTPELGDYLRTNARSSDPDKDILAILQKHQDIAPYWMMGQNGQTQGEFTIMPYVQTHSIFQGLAHIKNAPQSELVKYLDTPIVPVGDLYYIDNLVAVLEATDSDLTGDGKVDMLDAAHIIANLSSGYQIADLVQLLSMY